MEPTVPPGVVNVGESGSTKSTHAMLALQVWEWSSGTGELPPDGPAAETQPILDLFRNESAQAMAWRSAARQRAAPEIEYQPDWAGVLAAAAQRIALFGISPDTAVKAEVVSPERAAIHTSCNGFWIDDDLAPIAEHQGDHAARTLVVDIGVRCVVDPVAALLYRL